MSTEPYDPEETKKYCNERGIDPHDEHALIRELCNIHAWNSHGSVQVARWTFSDPDTRWDRLQKLTQTSTNVRVLVYAYLECLPYDAQKAWSIIQPHHSVQNHHDMTETIETIETLCSERHDILHLQGLYQYVAQLPDEKLQYQLLKIITTQANNYNEEIQAYIRTSIETYIPKQIWDSFVRHQYEYDGNACKSLNWLVWGDASFQNTFMSRYYQDIMIHEGPTNVSDITIERLEIPSSINLNHTDAWKIEHPQKEQFIKQWIQHAKHHPEIQRVIFYQDEAFATPNVARIYHELYLDNALEQDHRINLYGIMDKLNTMREKDRQTFWQHATYLEVPIWPIQENLSLPKCTMLLSFEADEILKNAYCIPPQWWEQIAWNVLINEKNQQTYFQAMKKFAGRMREALHDTQHPHYDFVRNYVQEAKTPLDALAPYFLGLVHMQLNEEQYTQWQQQWNLCMELGMPKNPIDLARQIMSPSIVDAIEMDHIP